MTSPLDLSVLIVGVGGQGVLTAARILGEAAHRAGLPVRLGQAHGMSQRGGSVESTVVLGPGRGAFLPLRGADVVVALEPLELRRSLPRLHARTRALASTGKVPPPSLALAGEAYPDLDDLLGDVRGAVGELVALDAPALAAAAGAPTSIAAVLLGALGALEWFPVGADGIGRELRGQGRGERTEGEARAFLAGLVGVGR